MNKFKAGEVVKCINNIGAEKFLHVGGLYKILSTDYALVKVENGGDWYDDSRFLLANLNNAFTPKLTTGGLKYDNGKPAISLIPAEHIEGMAAVFNYGAKKYGAHNYRLGFEHSRAIDAALRHIFAILRGQELDPETGLPHRHHAACSLAMYDYMALKHPDKNDLHELKKAKENK